MTPATLSIAIDAAAMWSAAIVLACVLALVINHGRKSSDTAHREVGIEDMFQGFEEE